MNFIVKAFKNLLPTGPAWKLFLDLKLLIEGMGDFFQRQKNYLDQTILESRPITSVEELPNWFRAFGITYNVNQPLPDRQARASQLFTARGGQSLGYIQGIVQKAFPQITLEPYTIDYQSMAGRGMAGLMMASNYPSWVPLSFQDGGFPVFIYRVVGEVESPSQLLQLQDILARIAPARLTPLYQDIQLFTNVMMAGIGEAGRGMAGRYPDQPSYDPIVITADDDLGLLFTSRHARFDGLGLFDGRTLLNPQANFNVLTVKFGDGTTPPDSGDTDLENSLGEFDLVITNNPNGTRTYSYTVDKATLNGFDISEVGLFGSYGMVWRYVFTPETKTNNLNIFFTFTEKEIA